MLVLHVVASPSGGGAEALAKELSKIETDRIVSKAVYFNITYGDTISKSDYCLSLSPRSFLSIFKIRRILKEELKKQSRVIVHAHLTWPLFFCRLAALWLPVTLVYTEHSTHNKRRNHPVLKWVDQWFYRGYRNVICISPAVRDALGGWLGSEKKLCVINNGAILGKFHPISARPPGVRLVSVGRLVPAKGFDIAIQAVAKMRAEVDSYLIWGDGPERVRLQALIDNLEAGDFIRLMGWSNRISEELSQASIQLIPSRWEGFGLAAVEGMSTGLPVLASAIPGLSEVVGEGEGRMLVQDCASPDAWISAIKTMNSRVARASDYVSSDVRKRSEMFSLDQMKALYAEFYAGLIV